jgi:hypothetical protein
MKTIAFLLLFVVQNGFAQNCLNNLRIIVQDSLANKSNLFVSDEAFANYKSRSIKVRELMRAFKSDEQITQDKAQSIVSKYLDSSLTFFNNAKVKTTQKNIWNVMHMREELLYSLTNLYREVFIRTLENGSGTNFYEAVTQGKISEEILVQRIVERVTKGGFNITDVSSIHVIKEGVLSAEEFGKILKRKDLFIDKAFSIGGHGYLGHLVQIDLVIDVMSRLNLQPENFADYYALAGEVSMQNGYNTHKIMWFEMFDSFSGNLTQPETFNPFATKMFGLEKF